MSSIIVELPDLKPAQYTGYNGNTNLKKANTPIQWTHEHVKEYMKCANDPVYFTKTYMKIISLDKGLIPFDLYDYQEHALKAAATERRLVMLTSRQAGKTSFATAFILHTIIFNEHKSVALLANKGDTAREILDRVQLAYEYLPFWLQQGIVEWNKGSVELENGCKVIAASTSGSAIRGKSINILYLDEAAFVENWDEFFASVYPTISAGKDTKLILTSTPNGLNHFYHIWQGANDTKESNGYYPIKVLWNDVPGRDEKWAEDALKALNHDQQKFDQEYNAEFQGSSGTLISGAALKRLKVGKTLSLDVSSGFYQYERSLPDRKYVMTVDVSRGKGLDYSAFHVIDITEMPFKQVAVYRNNLVTPLDYASIIYKTAVLYNHAHVLVEVNDIGGQVADSLHHDFEYENIIYTSGTAGQNRKVSNGFGGVVKERGLRTTSKTRTIGCSILKLLVEQDKLIITDSNTITELSVFSKKGDDFKYQAEPGHHDDLVMGLVLFSWLSDQEFFRNINEINTLQAARDFSEDQTYENLVPFGVVNNGLQPQFEKFDDDNSLWLKPEDYEDAYERSFLF